MHAASIVMQVVAVASTAMSGEVRFTVPPAAVRAGENVSITFTVSAETDVEVAVLNAKSEVVRHLAAGRLGANAPAPFTKGSLAQEIAWDGRNDDGELAAGRPFVVEVGIGSKPTLDRYLGWDSRAMSAGIAGLTVDNRGRLFALLSDIGSGRSEVRVLDRAGRYLRTIMPYPANTPRQRTAPIGHLEINGERLPAVFNAHGQNLHPLMSGLKKQHMVVHPSGHLLCASAVGTWAEHGPPRYLLALHTQGGAPEGVGFVGPQICRPRGFMGGAGERAAIALDSIATSPDGDWIYLTTNINSWAYKKLRHHAVFRLKWTDKKPGEPFLGAKEPGDDDAHFNDPQGVATDPKGNLYVCDRGNNRVMLFSAEGKLLGQFPVEHPQQIAIHPKSGEMYILCRKAGRSYKHPGTRLLKLSPWRQSAPRELARLERGGLVIELFALDATASPPKLWAALYSGWNRPDRLVPILDKGREFQIGEPVNNPNGLDYPMFISVDAPRRRLYVTHYRGRIDRIDLKTDGVTTGFLKGNEVVADRQGNLYVTRGWKLLLERLDPAGKPLPWPATGTNRLGPWPMGTDSRDQALWARSKGPNVGDRGHVIAPNGDLYVIVMSQYGVGRLDVYGPDGALKREGLIRNIIHGASGLAVDRAGNIYLGVNIKPLKGAIYPFGFDDHAPTRAWVWWHSGRYPWRRLDRETGRPWCYPYYNAYLYHWGAVLKFSPKGGRFWQWSTDKRKPAPAPKLPPEAVRYRTGYLNQSAAVEGALWRVGGLGPVPSSGLNWGDPSCTCWNARLAVDDYGRVFVPDPFRFSVEMLDTNGNHIARIGRYGNADSAGPRSAVPEPAIAFGWPAFVAAGGGKVYVSDCVNRRVAMVRFEHAANAACAIK